VGVMHPIECLQITEQMLEVLACAHTRGILHRDIKPANVFLCRDGSVKVLDFGLARVRELSAEALDQSDGIVFGTVSYIAPEQARADNQNLDARSDMWSVAATMFRALTGETVFPAEGPVIERLMAVARKPARSLASVDPRLPRLVVELVDRALAFDPDDRWPSANVMRVVVQDVLAQLTEEAEEAAGPVVEEEPDIEFHSPIFRRQPDSAPSRPRTDPVATSTRPKTDPNATHPRPAATRPQPNPSAAAAPRASRPKTDPFGVMPEELRNSDEPSPLPDTDEVDLDVDVDSLEAPSGKRGRTRTLLTKEGRAELRRILDARRVQKSKGDPTPEPVHMPTPTPVATPTPTPTPAPVHIEAVAQATPRVITQPSPVAPPVQPVRRATTEPSPVAPPIQPRPRVTTEPSPVAPPIDFSAMSSVELTIDEDSSMLESGMVVIQPEESIIELTIQHTRSGTNGTIAEPLVDTTSRPGPADSLTTAAFPAISTPRSGGPPAQRAPGVALTPDVEDSRAPATPAGVGRSTASYPAIGKPPVKSPPSMMSPPTRTGSEDVTKVGPAPLPPSASSRPQQSVPEPRATAVPIVAPGTLRPEEPAGDVTKVTRIPLPSFGKPTAPTAPPGPAPGPLPSRSSSPPAPLSAVSGEIGEERKPAATAGRWTPPVGKSSSEPAKPAAKTGGKFEPGKIEAPKAEPGKNEVKAEPGKNEVKAEPGKNEVKAEPGKNEVKAEPGKNEAPKATSPAKAEAKQDVKAEPVKPKFDPTRPTLTPAKAEVKPQEVKPQAVKPQEVKPQEVKPEPAKSPAAKSIERVPMPRLEPAPGKPAKAEAPRSDVKVPVMTDPAPAAKAPISKPEPSATRTEPPAAAKAPISKPDPSATRTESPAAKAPISKPEPLPARASAPVVKAPEPAKPASAAKLEVPRATSEPMKSPVGIKAELEKPLVNDPAKSVVVKPEAVKIEPEKPPVSAPPAASKPAEVAVPEPTPAPELKLPGEGLSRPAPRKSMFSVPYAGLGKTADRGDKSTSKPEPAEPAKGTPKKSS